MKNNHMLAIISFPYVIPVLMVSYTATTDVLSFI